MGSMLDNRGKAVFLCYHSVAEEGPRYLTVTADLFERHLAAIEERGLRTGGLDDLEAVAAGTATDRLAFLTFDDGFLDNHDTVLPLLRARGARAFCFVLPPLVDDGAPLIWPEVAQWQTEFPQTMRSVTWEMLGEMREGGFEIGSHTLTHPHLPDLHGERLREELSESRRRVIERLGSCDTLAYPFGEWTPEVAAAAGECGYRFAFSLPTTVGQRHGDPLAIPRINVDYRDEGRRFAVKLSGAGRQVYLSPRVHALRGSAKRARARRRAERVQ
jgi:peptidoglycan/xylan/chitin deacetylase (PgdA/CDA1 family)